MPATFEQISARSPFSSSSLPPDELERELNTFMAMFALCIETTNDDEEAWAFHKLKAAYSALSDSPPLDPVRNLPRGMWEAMKWAAELRESLRT